MKQQLLPLGSQPGLQKIAALLQLSSITLQLRCGCLGSFPGSCFPALPLALPGTALLLGILHLRMTTPIPSYLRGIEWS